MVTVESKFQQFLMSRKTACRAWGGLALLVLLALTCASALPVRAQTRPAAPSEQTPAPEAAPRKAKGQPPGQEQPRPSPPPTPAVAPGAPVAPQPRPGFGVVTPRAPRATTAPPRAAQPAPPAPPSAPPPKVVTVVHRLSGWKLLVWLAASGPATLTLDQWPSPADVHTNIVAGFVADDGRTVVTRLPQAAAEVEASTPAPFPPGLFAARETLESSLPELILVRSDGVKVPARFLGLDAATGLSLLEAAEPLLTPAGDVGDTEETPSVGQRLFLFAPTPVAQAPPTGDEGVIYMSMGETEGKVTEVGRAPTGKPLSARARAPRISPAWTGAVATDETGALVGIVSQSGGTETSIVTAEAMRAAIARVRARGASVPHPWLGARGDEVSAAGLSLFERNGWRPWAALPLINKQVGVLLTSVADGTPAFEAGLRPGDVVTRLNERDVRNLEDFSFGLREAGAGSTVNFTVLRDRVEVPLTVSVRLSETLDPALATAEAESRAARARSRRGVVAHAAPVLPRLNFFNKPLQEFGLNVLGLTPRSAPRLAARNGLLVVSVRPESAAALAGLRAGDVIEAVNGQVLEGIGAARLFPPLTATTDFTLSVVRARQRITVRFPPLETK